MFADWFLLALSLFMLPARQQEGESASQPASPRPEARIAAGIERVWPKRPEWADMMLAILKDEALDEDKGWWRASASLYGWNWLRERSDADRDSRVEPSELPRGNEVFDRLDRNEDGFISEADFDPKAVGEIPPGADALFRKLDSDGNDRVSWDELSWFFQQADRRKRGFITRRDLDRMLPDVFGGGSRPPNGEGSNGEGPPRDMPSKWGFLYLFFTGQLGSFREGPPLGAAAPDVRFLTMEKSETLRLSSLIGKQPVVLIFGSFT